MNEDQMHDAAEREMDIYRAQLDGTRAALAVTATERDELSQVLDQLKPLLDTATRALALASPEDADTAAVIRAEAGLPIVDHFSAEGQ